MSLIWKLALLVLALLGLLTLPSYGQDTITLPRPHVFHATDYALAAGVFVARAGDWASTEECLRRPYAQCHEVELPNALVHSKAGFAAFSFGVSAASFVFQYELTKHGHRTIARVFTAAHIGMTSATVIHNYQLIDNR
jgi:hypothetical protein